MQERMIEDWQNPVPYPDPYEGSTSRQVDDQRLETAKVDPAVPDRLADDVGLTEPLHERSDRDLGFELRERCAEAVVHTGPERDVLSGILSVQIEGLGGVAPELGVMVRSCERGEHERTLRNLLASQGKVRRAARRLICTGDTHRRSSSIAVAGIPWSRMIAS